MTLHYAIAVVTQGPCAPAVRLTAEPIAPGAHRRLPDGLHWHRYDISVPFERARHAYYVEGVPYHFWTPAPGDALRVAYASCNGDSHERRDRAPRLNRNRLWTQILRLHAHSPYHLMVHGGDQIYADRIWHAARERRSAIYRERPWQLLRHYVRRYLWLWRQPEIATVLSSIPCVMTWDDHDIHDGWGSKPPRGATARGADSLFEAARTACALFQHAELPENLPQALHWRKRIGHTALIGLDLRSERTPESVIADRTLAWLVNALADLRRCTQVLIVASTPLGGLNVAPVERLLDLCGLGPFSDLRDQWSSRMHRDQWVQVMEILFDHARATGAWVGILSGEIHHGAHTVLARGAQEIHQYISSGIAHRPLWLPLSRILDRCSRNGWSHGGIIVRPLPIDTFGHTLLPSENWLSLEVPADSLPFTHWQGETLGASRRVAESTTSACSPIQPSVS